MNLSQPFRRTCRNQECVQHSKNRGELRSTLNTLFRPFLLDAITMLGLAGETELANQFLHIQKIFLNALRQEPGTTIVLGEYLPIADLESAVDEYAVLIERNKRMLQ